jgi:futalosine hydrolase
MALNILLVTATSGEAGILKEFPVVSDHPGRYLTGICEIDLLVTGIGGISTSWSMKKWLDRNPKPDLAVNAGIAGSYDYSLGIGQVVVPVSDCFADIGIEDGENYYTLGESGLADPDEFPFKKGFIVSDNEYVDLALTRMQKARAITVNTSSGSAARIESLRRKFNPDIETMEGATFFYICAMEKIPFLAVRAISNKVEPRDRKRWNIDLALMNLEEKLKEIILMLR